MGIWILIPVFLPVIAGVLLLLPVKQEDVGDSSKESLTRLHTVTAVVLVVSAVLALLAA